MWKWRVWEQTTICYQLLTTVERYANGGQFERNNQSPGLSLAMIRQTDNDQKLCIFCERKRLARVAIWLQNHQSTITEHLFPTKAVRSILHLHFYFLFTWNTFLCHACCSAGIHLHSHLDQAIGSLTIFPSLVAFNFGRQPLYAEHGHESKSKFCENCYLYTRLKINAVIDRE